MTLPKVLAMAVGSTLTVGTAAALTLPLGHAVATPSAVEAELASSGSPVGGPGRTPTTLAGHAGSTVRTGSASGASQAGGAGSGLAVPASQVPLSQGLDPAEPLQAPLSPASGPPVALPTPRGGALPSVPPLTRAVAPDAVVMLNAPLTAGERAALPKLKGVTAFDTVDTGTVDLGGAPAVAFGVDPGQFRAFTPAASAGSDQLWQYLSGGALVASYEMATDRKLALGSMQTITSALAAPVRGWLGAFAAIGLPGVDMLVSHAYSPDLHLTPDSGVVVSAPSLSGAALEQELGTALPGAAVELLHPDQVPATVPGDAIVGTVRQKIVSAALSREGMPYVWGAAGPNSFDCSGLVQWAYRQAGILMPRVAAEQFLTGDHIPLADAQPGDLLFWTYDPSDPGYVDHVAIYLGNGMMVVAPHTGTDVQVTSVPTADFAGAVSVVVRKS